MTTAEKIKKILEYQLASHSENDLKEPFELFGIECGKGWQKIYEPIFDYIYDYNEAHQDDKIIVEQVKEKFGELRFYVGNAPQEVHDMVRDAEHKSMQICETCGSEVEIGYTTGWITTTCKKCMVELAKLNKHAMAWRPANSQQGTLLIYPDGHTEPKQNN